MSVAGALRLAAFTVMVVALGSWISDSHAQKVSKHEFGPFNSSYYEFLQVIPPATISNDALQVTPDSAGNFSLTNRSGRVFFNKPFKLWQGTHLVSFNSSFLINIYRLTNSSAGEGLAFLIAPDTTLPHHSYGQYLGLTNSTTDALSSNRFLAIELDTFKQDDFDPNDNHLGLDINSIRSNKTVSLSNFGIKIAPVGVRFHMVWVQYDGLNKSLDVYLAEHKQGTPVSRPDKPILSANIDLASIVDQYSYFGFAASTGNATQLNCILRWNLTVEVIPSSNGNSRWFKIGLPAGVSILATMLVIGVVSFGYYLVKKRRANSDPNILGTLKSLPGTPREFRFRELKKATDNFDGKHKLGQGGFGVVYRGLLPSENLEIAVKKFSRDNLQGKDDFLAELTIINRLRHKHLVRLLGGATRMECCF